MTSHATFIWAAYGFASLALAWCALAPWLKGRRQRQQLRAALQAHEKNHA